MSATVRAGEHGLDSSYSHPPIAAFEAEGATFRVGYISIPPAAPLKNITVAECEETIAAGIRLLLVWEMNSSRATLGGFYGAQDGANAKVEAQLRGQPFDVPIIVADDTGTTTLNLPKKVAYMRAAAVACAPYPLAIYAGVKLLAALRGLWVIGWVPITAWSWSVNLVRFDKETDAEYNARGRAAATQAAHDVGAHVLQRAGYFIDQTWAVDPNEAIADFPAWGQPDPAPTPTPTPPEDCMNYYVVTGANARFIGFPPNVAWTGPGDARVDAAIAAQLAAGNLAQVNLTGGPNAFASTFLTGPLPTGDSLHTWTGAEFAALLPANASTVDQAARDAAATANVGVATLTKHINAAGDALKSP